MNNVAPAEQIGAARKLRHLLTKYNKARDLIQLGAYVPGHDLELDLAVKLHADINALLQQDMYENVPLHSSCEQLFAIVQTS